MAEYVRKTADEVLKAWHVLVAAKLLRVFHANNQRTKNKQKPER